MRLLKTITPPIWRGMVFLGLFLLISGVTGPRIISGGILFRDGFAWYGGLGKAMMFGLIAFGLLARRNRKQLVLRPWEPRLLGWIVAGAMAFAVAWMSINDLLAGAGSLWVVMLAHAGLLLSVVLTAMGCMGPGNLSLIWRQYRREMVSAAALSAGFYVFLLAVYALWLPLAWVVLVSVRGLLSWGGLQAMFLPPNTLVFDKFGITVAEYCSGIESIALFTSLYVVVGLLDWDRLRKRRFFLVFPAALLVLFMLNILRVYGLILAGYYINPQLAFSLFHTYAGMVFFIVYSAIFWLVGYKYLVRHNLKGGEV